MGVSSGALVPARPRLAGISTTVSWYELSVQAKVVETGSTIVEEHQLEPVLSLSVPGSVVVEEHQELELVSSLSVPEFRKRLGVAEIKGGKDGGLKRVGQTMAVRG